MASRARGTHDLRAYPHPRSRYLTSQAPQAGLLSAIIGMLAKNFAAGPLWALAFVLSLTTAFLAISVQQWLRTVPDARCLAPRTAALLRQMPSVVCALVVLLQAAVVSFLVGFLVLLQDSHPAVVVKLVVAGVVAFLLYAFAMRAPCLSPRI